MPRDAQETRRRLLDAARDEFSTYGIAGARVDRIAAESGANKAQIYHYFGSKDDLFDAVFDEMVTEVITTVPIDVDDLPGYAARLADLYSKRPHVLRLATWQRLERGDSPANKAAVASIQAKLDEIKASQKQGHLRKDLNAAALLLVVQHTAALWSSVNPEFAAATGLPGKKAQLELVSQLVAQALASGDS
jgi:AcrR family transcriptional regulator